MSRNKSDSRLDVYRQCASELDWEWRPKDESGMIRWLEDFRLFKQGSGKKISPLILHKGDDLDFTSTFDYAYTVSTGKTTITFRQTVYFRYSKALALPHFILVPEKWYHRVGSYFGMQDIDFVEYPEFSQQYLLRGKDEDYIRYHFDHPEMVRYFRKQGGLHMEGMNYLLILYSHNVIMPRDHIRQLIQSGNTFHNYFSDKTPDIQLPEAPDFTGI